MDVLSDILERRRDVFNQQFRIARQSHPWIEQEEFVRLLQQRLAPLATVLPENRRPEVVEELYTLLLELMGKNLLGSRSGHGRVEEVWEKLLPAAPDLVAAAPRKVVASLCNAAWNLGLEPNARPERWLAGMQRLAPACPQPELWLAVGLVQGWRHGLAWMRDGAIQIWKTVPDPLKIPVLEIEEAPLRQVERDLEDPWCKPGKLTGARGLKLRMLGGFRGFGGAFLVPPRVESRDGHLYATAGGQWWAIHADFFGATVRKVEAPSGTVDEFSEWKVGANGRVEIGELSEQFVPLRNVSSVATTPFTLLATSPHSHKLMVVARLPVERGA